MAAKLLDLKKVMAAADKKDYDFYDNLSDEDKKLFSPYMAMRWLATVSGNEDLQVYYLLSTNEKVNTQLWDINKHPKLSWLSIAAASPGVGNQNHQWVGSLKKNTKKTLLRKKIIEYFPTIKDDEIDIMIELNSDESLREWFESQGLDNKEIKELLK